MTQSHRTQSSPDSVHSEVDGLKRRRVIKARSLEPLDPGRRYVPPEASRVGFVPGFFSWSWGVAKPGREHGRKVKVGRGAFEPDGLRAPTQHHRKKARFNQYFELGTGINFPTVEISQEDRIRRNRIIFLVSLAAVIGYCAYWLLSA
ncbi:MAG: hypothetical protein JJU05_07120 [Verrucomicrobia bacterium]|nr:hypothetical protein [Verrucomicrobiota bacterium]MCH8526068.1 hypothetical protein [Kiritimatiellia bacterium]